MRLFKLAWLFGAIALTAVLFGCPADNGDPVEKAEAEGEEEQGVSFDTDPIHIDPTTVAGMVTFYVNGDPTPGDPNVIRDDFGGVARKAVAHYLDGSTTKKTGAKSNMTIEYLLQSGDKVLVLLFEKTATMYVNGNRIETYCDPTLRHGSEGACVGNGMPSNAAGPYDDEVVVNYPKLRGGLQTRDATLVVLK